MDSLIKLMNAPMSVRGGGRTAHEPDFYWHHIYFVFLSCGQIYVIIFTIAFIGECFFIPPESKRQPSGDS